MVLQVFPPRWAHYTESNRAVSSAVTRRYRLPRHSGAWQGVGIGLGSSECEGGGEGESTGEGVVDGFGEGRGVSEGIGEGEGEGFDARRFAAWTQTAHAPRSLARVRRSGAGPHTRFLFSGKQAVLRPFNRA